MKVDIYSSTKQQVGHMQLNREVFSCPLRTDILHQVVNWQLAKRRLGTHQTKEVGDVRASTRKIHAQKGTGRARHGSVKAPQFRGGGVSFGPHVRDHDFKLNKKVRRLALRVALSDKLRLNHLFVIDSLDEISGKTKDALHLAKMFESSSMLLVDAELNPKVIKAVANLHGLDVLPVMALNVYDILAHQLVLVTSNAVNLIEARLK